MKTIGWLWAWVRTYLDWVLTGAAAVFAVAYWATAWPPLCGVFGALAFAALTSHRGHRTSRRGLLRLHRRRSGWSDGHPSVRAAKQREIELLDEWWDLPAADDARKEQGQ